MFQAKKLKEGAEDEEVYESDSGDESDDDYDDKKVIFASVIWYK